MLINQELLQEFSGVETTAELAEIYIESAQQKIKDYVGFDPETAPQFEKEHQEFFTVYSEDGINFFEDAELTKPAEIPEGVIPVLIEDNEYSYSIIVTEIVVPKVFKLVCLEIATLIQAEEGSNIGVNTSGDAGVSRTYLNVADFTKYLQKLSTYRKPSV